MTIIYTKRIINIILILIILNSCSKEHEIFEPSFFPTNIYICDTLDNQIKGLEVHLFLTESSYISDIPDTIITNSGSQIKSSLTNKEQFFWIKVYYKNALDNLVKINLDDKFSLPSKNLKPIKEVNYKVKVKDPFIRITGIVFEFSNVKDDQYVNGDFVSWDRYIQSTTERRPDLQFIIENLYESQIFIDQYTLGRVKISVDIIITDLDHPFRTLLIDYDDSNSFDLVFNDALSFRKISQDGIKGLPLADHNENFRNSPYNYFTCYGSYEGDNDRPIVLIYNTEWTE